MIFPKLTRRNTINSASSQSLSEIPSSSALGSKVTNEHVQALEAAMASHGVGAAEAVWSEVCRASETDPEAMSKFAVDGGAGLLFEFIVQSPLASNSVAMVDFAWQALAELASNDEAAKRVSDVKTLLFNMTLLSCCVGEISKGSVNCSASLRILRSLAVNHLEIKHKMLTYPRLFDAVLSADDPEAWAFLVVLTVHAPFSLMQQELYRIAWKHSRLVERTFAAVKSSDVEVQRDAFTVFRNLALNHEVLQDMLAKEEFSARLQKYIRRALASGSDVVLPIVVEVLQLISPEGHGLETATLESMREAMVVQPASMATCIVLLLQKWSEFDVNKTKLLHVNGMVEALRDLLEKTDGSVGNDKENADNIEKLLTAALELLQNLSLAPAASDSQALVDTPRLLDLVVQRFSQMPLQSVSCVLFTLKNHPGSRDAIISDRVIQATAELRHQRLHSRDSTLIKTRLSALEHLLVSM